MNKQAVYVILTILTSAVPAWAYHPFSTDDPGTVDYRHFQIEWGNNMSWPDDNKMEEFTGYGLLRGGLAKGLEFDVWANFAYWHNNPAEGFKNGQYYSNNYVSGWGDVGWYVKYRFLGDGAGSNNLAIAASAMFPAGEKDKGLSDSDNIVPKTYLIYSYGTGPLRFIVNAGATFTSDEDEKNTMLYGGELEWSVKDNLQLGIEVYRESDLVTGGGNDPLEGLAGFAFCPKDWLTFSAGAGVGMAPDSPNFHFTFATVIGW